MTSNPNARHTVLVTGASAGIGKSFAEVFAENGFDVVLVARREARLNDIAGQLEARFRIKAHVIPADLSDPSAPRGLFEATRAADIHIDALVNNAGFGIKRGFTEVPWLEHHAYLQVMLACYAELCHLFIPAMVDKGYGRIVNVASLAAFLPPLPGSLYAGTKAFLIKMSQALSREFRDRNVYTTAVCPGFTYTEFHDVLGNREQVSKFPRFMWMDSRTVARQGYRSVMRGDFVYVNGFVNRVLATLGRIVPAKLAETLLAVSPYKNDVRR